MAAFNWISSRLMDQISVGCYWFGWECGVYVSAMKLQRRYRHLSDSRSLFYLNELFSTPESARKCPYIFGMVAENVLCRDVYFLPVQKWYWTEQKIWHYFHFSFCYCLGFGFKIGTARYCV